MMDVSGVGLRGLCPTLAALRCGVSFRSAVQLCVALIVTLAVSTSADPQRRITEEDTDSITVEVDGDCAPDVWQRAMDYWKYGRPRDTAWASAVLTRNLEQWNSECKSVIKRLLQGIGKHQPVDGPQILRRYLQSDLSLLWAETIVAQAAKALAEYDRAVAFGPLVEAAMCPSERVACAAVLGLGRIEDERSVGVLEELLGSSSQKIRESAFVALSHYCVDSSMGPAVVAMESESAEVRRGAMSFLSWCGGDGEVPLLLRGLSDEHEAVRIEALRGLVRLGSKEGCTRVGLLLGDRSTIVKALATEYGEMCEE